MWLLNVRTYKLEEYIGSNVPKYAILSHRWEDGEVNFKAMQKGTGEDLQGQYKIQKCCQQAISDGLSYVWIDTCCIDKRSSAELSEAINSMFRWYRAAKVCYAFLSDVNAQIMGSTPVLADNFTESSWFTRGWTLQELLAPAKVMFFDSKWQFLGSKRDHAEAIGRKTHIPMPALEHFVPEAHTIHQKMLWAKGRRTTRVEDRAYCLLGLFSLHMPLLYGEGEQAFLRLQRELVNISGDASMFAFSGSAAPSNGMLAASPDSFVRRDVCNDLSEYRHDFSISNLGIIGSFHMSHFALDIYATKLGNADELFHGKNYCWIFLRWRFDLGRYERVRLDGQNYIFTSIMMSNDYFVTCKEIQIGSLRLVDLSSMSLSQKRLDCYLYPNHHSDALMNTIYMLPGRCGNRSTISSTSVSYYDFHASMPFSLTHWMALEREGQDCICLGQSSVISDQNEMSRMPPSVMLTLGVNIKGDMVSLLSPINFPDGILENINESQRCTCANGKFCWYSHDEYFDKFFQGRDTLRKLGEMDEWQIQPPNRGRPVAPSRTRVQIEPIPHQYKAENNLLAWTYTNRTVGSTSCQPIFIKVGDLLTLELTFDRLLYHVNSDTRINRRHSNYLVNLLPDWWWKWSAEPY